MIKGSVGFLGLPATQGFSGAIAGNVAPAPSNAETLRHIAGSVSGDDPMNTIFAGTLLRAAEELEASQKTLKAVRAWAEDTHELESYGSVRSDNGSRLLALLDGKGEDAPQNAG